MANLKINTAKIPPEALVHVIKYSANNRIPWQTVLKLRDDFLNDVNLDNLIGADLENAKQFVMDCELAELEAMDLEL